MTVGIAGKGWVGNAMKSLFPDALLYDPNTVFNDISVLTSCDVVFVCVPTNLDGDDLDTSIVEEVVRSTNPKLFVIRSTVPPGTTDKLIERYHKKIVMQPEYLGETPNHPLSNTAKSHFLIIGGAPEDRQTLIELYQSVYNANIRIREVTAIEAEFIKLACNRAGAFKVAQCQELYDVCQAMNLNYNTIREAVYGDDPRHNLWWTFVYPHNRGFSSSKCYKKDIPAFIAAAKRYGYDPMLTMAMLACEGQYQEPGVPNETE